VTDSTFGVEKGQTFCLLGPNGAGKSTTFNILTAAVPRTSGTVEMIGLELDPKNHDLFEQIGICPQVNPFWEDLTVVEHMRIFAKVKNVKPETVEILVNFFLDALSLREHANKTTYKLSGGNKRKLAVALSLIGGPTLQFMDEPSTGMDPVARKYLWSLLKKNMAGHKGAMVLTTHYMAEAESIGDKIGILINGTMAVVGSVEELKQRYGEYTISIEENLENRGDMKALITSVLPGAKKASSIEKVLQFKVPSDQMQFAAAFSALEQAKLAGNIKDFSIYTTTMEQIFIKFAKFQRKMTAI